MGKTSRCHGENNKNTISMDKTIDVLKDIDMEKPLMSYKNTISMEKPLMSYKTMGKTIDVISNTISMGKTIDVI